MQELLATWHQDHLAEICWTVFGVVAVFVFLWKRIEPRLRAYVLSTPNLDDDAAVELVSGLVNTLSRVVDVLSLFVPRALSITTRAATKVASLPEPEPLAESPTVPEPHARTARKRTKDKAPPPAQARKKRETRRKTPEKQGE